MKIQGVNDVDCRYSKRDSLSNDRGEEAPENIINTVFEKYLPLICFKHLHKIRLA